MNWMDMSTFVSITIHSGRLFFWLVLLVDLHAISSVEYEEFIFISYKALLVLDNLGIVNFYYYNYLLVSVIVMTYHITQHHI